MTNTDQKTRTFSLRVCTAGRRTTYTAIFKVRSGERSRGLMYHKSAHWRNRRGRRWCRRS